MDGVSPAFLAADRFTAREEGGYNPNDVGSPANFGINQAAHPGIDVGSLTADKARAIRYQYWRAIDGDALAAHDPRLALVAYDTAIMSGPARAVSMVRRSGGDPAGMLQLRQAFLGNLVASNPEKYGKVAHAWSQRDAALATQIGSASMAGDTSLSKNAPTDSAAPSPIAPAAAVAQAAPPPAPPAQVAPAAAPKPEAAPALGVLTPQAPGSLTPRTNRDLYLSLLRQPQGMV